MILQEFAHKSWVVFEIAERAVNNLLEGVHSWLCASSTMRTVVRPCWACSIRRAFSAKRTSVLDLWEQFQAEIVGNHLEELVGVDSGVEKEGEFDELRVKVIAEALEHGGLAGADLPGQDDKPLAAMDTVDQVCEGLLMLGAAVEERRVRAEIEGAFPEAEKGVVHKAALSIPARERHIPPWAGLPPLGS